MKAREPIRPVLNSRCTRITGIRVNKVNSRCETLDYPIHLDDACLLTLVTLVLNANTPSKLALHPDHDTRTASAVVAGIHVPKRLFTDPKVIRV